MKNQNSHVFISEKNQESLENYENLRIPRPWEDDTKGKNFYFTISLKVTFSQKIFVLQKLQNKKTHLELLFGPFCKF